MDEAKQIKEQGNQLFKEGKHEEALSCYTKALSLDTSGASERNVYLKNRAACYLKLGRYSDAQKDCTTVLDATPGDPKALFRRCQALEQLGSHEAAYKDAMLIVRLDPKNAAIQPILRRLSPIIQDKIQKLNSTESKVSQMFDLAIDSSTDDEKRKQAANNLIVLAREEAGADQIFRSDGIKRLEKLMHEKDHELRLTAIRVLACLAQNNKERATAILDQLSLKLICIFIGNEMEDVSTVMAHVLRNIIMSVTDIEKWKAEREKHEVLRKDICSKLRPYPFISQKIDEAAMKVMDYIFPALITMIGHHKVSGYGRDNAMELILKFVTRVDGCGWTKYFIVGRGIQSLLEVAGTVPEHKTLTVTANTRMHTSLCLSKIWDDLSSDSERDQYREAVNGYFNDMFGDNIMESKLEAIMALTALLQGPLEVGNTILAREGVLEILLAMADSGDIIHTKYAVEALVHSTSKKSRCSGLIKQATPILKELYQSQNDAIKVRALVGLCKLGSFGGGDASVKTFAEGSTRTLAKACRRYLCNASKDIDLRKWAAEGLAYLTLDAQVKHELVDDTNAINSLIDLAKIPDKGILYPVAQILVNATNSYDKVDVEPELIELAKFSKQHVPEEHKKDKEPYISERIKKLLQTGVVNALVVLSKTESESSRELLARVYLALVMDPEHRGLIVQQGGAKALIPLANSGTGVGKAIAAQALAKIAITQNPEIAFPGQRACEVVRPILQLLAIEKTALQNFEALLALTNLASVNDTIRSRIVKEEGIAMIEHYLYEEHERLRQAAMECMCNMVLNEEVEKSFQGDNDRLKLVVLFSGEEEEGLVRAAAGCLAILSSERSICHKITTCTKQWFQILQQVLVCETPDIQHRGAYTVMNMISADKELAARLIESDMLEVLMALSRLEGAEFAATQTCANDALAKAVEWGIIKNTTNPSVKKRSLKKVVENSNDDESATTAENVTPVVVVEDADTVAHEENTTPVTSDENTAPVTPVENTNPVTPVENTTPITPEENTTPVTSEENTIPSDKNAMPATPAANATPASVTETTPSVEVTASPAENSTPPS